MPPIFSRRDAEAFTPPGSGRTYTIAPLTFRERQAFRADLAREGGIFPARAQLLDALRAAVREMAPANAHELLAAIDAGETTPDDTEAQAKLSVIEAVCTEAPGYAALLAARQRYLGMVPWVAARHALRGWSGDGLPDFRRDRGVVPADLLDVLPDEDIEAVGWRASELMQPGPSAEGNSERPSPSPSIPEPTTEG